MLKQQDNKLNQTFLNQFEEMADEELATVTGGGISRDEATGRLVGFAAGLATGMLIAFFL